MEADILTLKKIIKVILLISIILFFVSLSLKNIFPDRASIRQELYQEPLQTETKALSIERTVKGLTYNIVPLYHYELYGLVVSHTNPLAWYNYYGKASKDYINTKDITVIYGENIKNEVYKKMKFWNDAWTSRSLYKKGFEQEASLEYKNEYLSNNHLLAANEQINKTIINLRTGDQVYLKGYLVKYTTKSWNNNWRISSSIRTDLGCEALYVNNITILARANVFWNAVNSFTKYLIFGSVVALLVIFLKTPFSNLR